MKKLLITLSLAISSLGFAQLPPGYVDDIYLPNLSEPLALASFASGHLLIARKGGQIHYFNGEVNNQLIDLNVSVESERGLLGIAVDPDFQGNGYIYVYYTTNSLSLNPPPSPKNRVSRLTVTMVNGAATTINPNSELILLDNIASDAGNHNAGCLKFGADGLLYIATGDGGAFPNNSQTLSNLAGKILRINKLGGIPGNNPFINMPGARPEIFCYGLRNPFRFSFRPGTNTLFIADVGQSAWEEINVSTGGENFGWPVHEGPSGSSPHTRPIYSYPHTQEQRASIIGGVFLNNNRFPQNVYNHYLHGDIVRGLVYFLNVPTSNNSASLLFNGPVQGAVDFLSGWDGNLFYASLVSGGVRRIAYQPKIHNLNAPNGFSGQPLSIEVTLQNVAPVSGQSVTLSSNSPIVPVPSSVTLANGQQLGAVNVTAGTVASNTTYTITGTTFGVTATDSGVISPTVAQTISSVTLAQTTVESGNSTTGTVNLNAPAPSGGRQVLLSSNSSAVRVPPSVTVAQGGTSATFQVRTNPTTAQYTRLITASTGPVKRSVAITLLPTGVQSLVLNPTTVKGGNPSTGTVTLAQPAPAGGAEVTLSDNSSALSTPPALGIGQGQTQGAFTVTTSKVGATYTRTVSASYRTVTKVASLTLTP